jgi:glycerophosphoryl diester phosphodiesterase
VSHPRTVAAVYPDLVPTESCPSWLREVPLAHRGLHDGGERPENSLAAFAAAAEAGYGVELDVMLSRDRVPVISHDPTLMRSAERPDRIADLTVAELAAVTLGRTREHVPTLAAALGVLREVPVMVEVKQPALRAGSLEAAVAPVMDSHHGPWCVASFNPATLRWFRRRRPEAVRVLTAGPIDGVRLPRMVRRHLTDLKELQGVAPHAVSYDLTGLPNGPCDAWRGRGGVLVTWTVDSPTALARARELADNVIFEHLLP